MILLSETEFSWNKTIRKIANSEFNRMRPSCFFIAQIMNISPLKLKKGQNFIISEKFIKCTETFKDKFREELEGKKIEVGDKVLVFQNQGGQEYVIIDRIV